MATTTASTAHGLDPADARTTAPPAAQAAAILGALACVTMTIVWFTAHLVDDGTPYVSLGDYLYTGMGIPMALAPLVLLPAVRRLQGGRDGRLGAIGVGTTVVTMVVFLCMFVTALIQGVATSWGPTYVLATLGSVIGVATFCAGSWRAGLLPRPLLAAWGIAWTVGGMLGPKGSQLLLAAVYLAIAAVIRRRTA